MASNQPINKCSIMAMAWGLFNDGAGVLSNLNAYHEFFSWTASVITAIRHSTSESPDKDKTAAQPHDKKKFERLEVDLWKLRTTMPKMLDLIDRVEFLSHKEQAAALLPDIKGAVFDAEDLLDEFDYDVLKLKVECSKNLEPDHYNDTFLEFSARSSDYIRQVNDGAGVLSNLNACHEFFSWTSSVITAIRYQQSASESTDRDKTAAQPHDKMKFDRLEVDLWKLKTTMPKMHDLIDKVEFLSHKKKAADLLPDIKDAVFDAEDLLDEFDYDVLKLKVECSKNLEPDHYNDTFLEFFDRSSDYIRQVNVIQEKLDHIYKQAIDMHLHLAPRKFDKSVRPETSTYFNCVEKMVGREKEMKELVGKLGVHGLKRGRTESKATMTELPVVSIVGMGGVGKTTMAQQICKNTNVKNHFGPIIWTCVSDEFDTKRLTKEIIEGFEGDASSDSLDVLMGKLEGRVKSKKFLLVLDDMWDNTLKDDATGWKSLCACLENGTEGSRILVTTRFPEVAELVGPMNNYELNGLEPKVFWDFFKSCVFGSMSSCNDQESLERIAKDIVPKLKGSPLAAKTIGRLLRMELSKTHWENIKESELWRLKQTDTDILPALRLSYMYLSQKLKRCFSICAMFPKDHKYGSIF